MSSSAQLESGLQSAPSGHRMRFVGSHRRLVVVAALLVTFGGGAAVAAHALDGSGSSTDGCIHINGGDFNACNAANSGHGDLPYIRGFHQGKVRAV